LTASLDQDPERLQLYILLSVKAQNLETFEEKRNFLGKIGSNFILAGGRARFSVEMLFNLYFRRPAFTNWSDLYSEARTVFEEGRDKDLITLEE